MTIIIRIREMDKAVSKRHTKMHTMHVCWDFSIEMGI